MKVKTMSRHQSERLEYYRSEWRPWFAWRPVVTEEGFWVWLVPLERTADIIDAHGIYETCVIWRYRELDD